MYCPYMLENTDFQALCIETTHNICLQFSIFLQGKRIICVYNSVVHFFGYIELSTSTSNTKYLVPTQVDPPKMSTPLLVKRKPQPRPKFMQQLHVYVLPHYITKSAQNGLFRGSNQKKILQRPPLTSDFTQESLSFSESIGHFY